MPIMNKKTSQPEQPAPEKDPEEIPEIFAVEKDGKKTRFSRRDFVKVAAVSASAAAVLGCDASRLLVSPTPLINTQIPVATEVPLLPTDTMTKVPTSTTVPSLTPIPIPMAVAKDTTNVRYGPSESAGLVGSIPKGDSAMVIGKSSDSTWFCIQKPGGSTGWVSSSMVDLVGGQADTIPVITPMPTPTNMPGRAGKTAPGETGIDYSYTNEFGTEYTFTLPCGSNIPPGAVCACNCVTVPCSCVSYTPCSCVSYTPCSCDNNVGCDCDTHSACSCDQDCNCVGAGHYWYPG
jgi:hypothetical protein